MLDRVSSEMYWLFFSKALFKRLDNRKFYVIFNLGRIMKEGRVRLTEKAFQV
jgi:hypothetical protein